MASVFNSKAQILKIYVPERRMKDDQPLCEWIVHRACERGIAGATVIDPVKSPEIISMQVMRPVIIEIVDQPERIEGFAAFLKSEVSQVLMCRSDVDVCFS